MPPYSDDFGPFGGRIWLNAASIGAMPKIAIEAAHEAISWNVTPSHLSEEIFHDVPLKLKEALGRLIGTPAQEIILGNSASYGLHLWANGLPFNRGDEILLVKGDFPATILPWLGLRKQGIIVKEIQPKGPVLHVDDVKAHLTDSTKVLCATWVDSFTGFALDVKAIGNFCRDNGVWFLLNGTQALGARPLNVSKMPVDGVTSCGYKWLCGPYGTGFCWLHPKLLAVLEYNQLYWIVMKGERDFDQIRDYQIRNDLGAEQYDVFCTANFFNFVPWIKSVEYLLAQGITEIQQFNDKLVERFLQGLDSNKYSVLSPKELPERTAIIIVSHRRSDHNREIFHLLTNNGIDLTLREGNLRFSPHLYNTFEEIEQTISILNNSK